MNIITRSTSGLRLALLMAAAWSAAAYFFYAPTTPLNQSEIDRYMVDVKRLLEVSFVQPEGVGLSPDGLAGAMKDLQNFAENDDGKAIYMVNLMKWREGELAFPAGADLADSIKTREEADTVYNQRLFWDLLANNSHTAYLAGVQANAFNYGTSQDSDGWGEIGIFRYNSRRDFFNMISSDSYGTALYLKLVAMGAIAIAPSQPHGLLFNPMPNVPVLLFFVLVIFYLIFFILTSSAGPGTSRQTTKNTGISKEQGI